MSPEVEILLTCPAEHTTYNVEVSGERILLSIKTLEAMELSTASIADALSVTGLPAISTVGCKHEQGNERTTNLRSYHGEGGMGVEGCKQESHANNLTAQVAQVWMNVWNARRATHLTFAHRITHSR